jgi:hypothetical protein
MECNYGLCPWHGPLRPIRMLAKLENNVAALKLVVGQDRQAMHRMDAFHVFQVSIPNMCNT